MLERLAERVTEAGAVFESDHRGCSAMTLHRHAAPYLTIVLSGAYIEVHGSEPEVCSAGTIVVHHAAEEHADRFGSDTRCLNVELPLDGPVPARRGAIALDAPELRCRVRTLIEKFYSCHDGLGAAISSLQSSVLERSIEPQQCEQPAWLRRAIAEFPWTDSLPLSAAAAVAGVHETHFSREFRRYVGMTASEYRARERMKLASQQLLQTTYELSQIALNTGFSDQSHFTRFFTERLGLTPAAYRRTFAR